MGFLIGATDTTPSALCQGLLRLKMDPKVWKTLEKEINNVIPDAFDLNLLTFEMIDKCDELSYFCKEVLWIDAPAFVNFNQVAKETFEIDDIVILKGTDI